MMFKGGRVIAALVVCALCQKTPAQTWVPTSAPTNTWSAVASSADGTRLIAATDYGPVYFFTNNGPIYLSTNSGLTWATNNSPFSSWTALASSADGTRLFAACDGPLFYISTNGGASWSSSNSFSAQNNSNDVFWTGVACSADGNTVVASSDFIGSDIFIFASTNLAATCTVQDDPAGSCVECYIESGGVTSSAAGTQMVASFGMGSGGNPATEGYIGISSDSGITWNDTAIEPPFWNALASSASGSNVVAAASDGFNSPIYTSSDGGLTFNATGSPADDWVAVASSADGTRLAAAPLSGAIYTSADAGVSWNSNNAPALNWTSLASSADGTRLVAASSQGIYVLQPPPALNIVMSSGALALSWPSTTILFGLQQTCALTATNWTVVTNCPSFANGWYHVTLSPTNTATFYRLQSP